MKKPQFSLSALFVIWTITLIACSDQLPPINVDADGVALKGYDPVAFFTLGHPEKGQKEHTLEWNNAKWLFSSQGHRAMFQEDPARYAPQYGGY
jgi:hypothetical protein